MSANSFLIGSFIILFVLFFSCNNITNKHEETEKVVTEWIGKTIQFPNNMVFLEFGRDTVSACFSKTPYKILLYSDSIGCTSCKLKLLEWQSLIQESDTTLNGKLSFIFCFYPKNKKELQLLLIQNRFNYPVFVDMYDELNNMNRLPQKSAYQCFLLDQWNKVISIGNPVLNTQVWELYKQIIIKPITN